MFFSDDLRELVLLLQKHEVEFAVCGGFAVAHYGFVRMTMDFDLLVRPDSANADRLMRALAEFGFGDAGFTAEDFTHRGAAVTLGEQPNQIDLLTSMSSRDAGEIIARARSCEFEGLQVRVVAYDDLIEAKKEAGRAKDRIDIEELENLNQPKRKP